MALLHNILHAQTARDKQRHIGASQFSDSCDYCVGRALANPEWEKVEDGLSGRTYWLGATLGTGIHNYVEHRILEEKILGDPNRFIVEKSIKLGELPGYGEIYSRPDCLDTLTHTLHDWKTTTKDKLKWYKEIDRSGNIFDPPGEYEPQGMRTARHTLKKYYGQIMSYARGLELNGHKVNSVALEFVCRDGKTSADIYPIEREYDKEYGERVWNRLERMWDWIRNGGDYEDLTSAEECYSCSRR